MKDIDRLLENRIYTWSSDTIFQLLDKTKNPNLNNVVERLEKRCFQILLKNENNIDEYDLVLIVNYDKLEGYSLKSNRFIENRDLLTYQFCRFLSESIPDQNEIILFNTFQNMLISTYESFGIFCITEELANLKNTTFILKGKKSVEHILVIERINFFRSFFERNESIENKTDLEKVYLMYDLDDDLFKIGFTRKTLDQRKKGVAEPTIRGKKPKIGVICSWNASTKIEKELQTKYNEYRKRGEWFDLNPRNLKELNNYMIEYPMIKIQ